jgi:hypothetical protein
LGIGNTFVKCLAGAGDQTTLQELHAQREFGANMVQTKARELVAR